MTGIHQVLTQESTVHSEEVRIKSGDLTLAATLHRPVGPSTYNGAILLINGWGSERDPIHAASIVHSNSIFCLDLDLRGHGKSDGVRAKHLVSDFLGDALAAYDFLANTVGVDPSRIGISGASFGAYLGALITAQRSVAFLAMRSPADCPDERYGCDSFGRILADRISYPWLAKPKSSNDTHALRAISHFDNPTLLIECGDDKVIPAQTIKNYQEAISAFANFQYNLIANAPHSLVNNPLYQSVYTAMLCHWLSETIPSLGLNETAPQTNYISSTLRQQLLSGSCT